MLMSVRKSTQRGWRLSNAFACESGETSGGGIGGEGEGGRGEGEGGANGGAAVMRWQEALRDG